MCTHTHICTHTYTHKYVQINLQIYMCTHIYIHIYRHVCVCIHIFRAHLLYVEERDDTLLVNLALHVAVAIDLIIRT